MSQLSFEDLLINDELTNEPQKATRPPSSPLHGRVKVLLLNGSCSTVEICESLIDEGLISKRTYSTGKPLAYPTICKILDEFVESGLIEFVQDCDRKDRLYRLKE